MSDAATLSAPDAQVFHAIADPTRRALLDRLAGGEQPVKTLAEPFAMSRPAISQHLKVLRDAGVVAQRKVGREQLYRLEAEPLQEVFVWVRRYERFWTERFQALGDYLDRTA